MHVTLRAVSSVASLRRQTVFAGLHRAFRRASREWFRVVHFSVQANHVHLVVEASDKSALSRGMGGLSIRLARAINGKLRRRGRVWADRYHARALKTPTEVRRGLVYVLTNWRKHVPRAQGFDPCSSAIWFDGWKEAASPLATTRARADSPVARPRTWLAALGWRRRGLIRLRERPSEVA